MNIFLEVKKLVNEIVIGLKGVVITGNSSTYFIKSSEYISSISSRKSVLVF
ncbi:17114_t:CDS:2 [Funneliformis geosporum]|nr:17114_t:CDS:2 [Funneliformis geosporum]